MMVISEVGSDVLYNNKLLLQAPIISSDELKAFKFSTNT